MDELFEREFSLDEPEKSLCANWLRIKGDSKLSIDEALRAIRAAWERAAQAQLPVQEEEDEELSDLTADEESDSF